MKVIYQWEIDPEQRPYSLYLSPTAVTIKCKVLDSMVYIYVMQNITDTLNQLREIHCFINSQNIPDDINFKYIDTIVWHDNVYHVFERIN